MKMKDYLRQQENQYRSELPAFNELNPLGHQFDGFNIHAEMIPTQLQNIFEVAPLQHKHTHTVPLTKAQYSAPEEEEDDDDSSWITE